MHVIYINIYLCYEAIEMYDAKHVHKTFVWLKKKQQRKQFLIMLFCSKYCRI